MHLETRPNARLLVTTPDYPPKLGGLSTFTLTIEKVLDDLGIVYDRLVWSSVRELKSSESKRSYEFALHIHFMAGHFLSFDIKNHINIIHGSEILFYSPNPLKRFIKSLLRKKMLDYISSSRTNIFISEVTRWHLMRQGHHLDYGRDLVVHNCIDLKDDQVCVGDFKNDEIIKMVCVARDVAHKNIRGAMNLCQSASKILGKKIIFYVTAPLKSSSGVEVVNISGISNENLQDFYRQAHFNILLSLDHHKRGFFEGFGLTVLEAGQYGTPSIVSGYGGLVESVHHQQTGWVLKHLGKGSLNHFWSSFKSEDYQEVCHYVYRHTRECHGLNHYTTLLGKLLR